MLLYAFLITMGMIFSTSSFAAEPNYTATFEGVLSLQRDTHSKKRSPQYHAYAVAYKSSLTPHLPIIQQFYAQPNKEAHPSYQTFMSILSNDTVICERDKFHAQQAVQGNPILKYCDCFSAWFCLKGFEKLGLTFTIVPLQTLEGYLKEHAHTSPSLPY